MFQPLGGSGGTGGGGIPQKPAIPFGYSFDKPYKQEWDGKQFTAALIASGYRPYKLIREDNGQQQTIWARPVLEVVGWEKERLPNGEWIETVPIVVAQIPDLSRYARGRVIALPIEKKMVVSPTAVIVTDERDGGYINEHGRVISTNK